MKKLFLPSLLLLSACGYRTVDKPCSNGVLHVFGTGFTKADLSNAKVSRYKQDGAFDSMIVDTPLVTSDYKKDTVILVTLRPGYDYKLNLPATSRTYLVTGVVQSGKTHQTFRYQPNLAEHSFICYNWVASCAVDGQVIACVPFDRDTMITSVCIVK